MKRTLTRRNFLRVGGGALAGAYVLGVGEGVAPAQTDSGIDWRDEAGRRIEEYRKADLRVVVRDAQGRLARGSEVRVRMLRHAFRFGTAVDDRFLEQNGPETEDGRIYREKVASLFNYAVIEDGMKWRIYEEHPNRAMAAVDWLRGEGIEVRGHAFVWGVPGRGLFVPDDIYANESDPDYVRARLDAHISALGERFRGKVTNWDVLNEPLHVRYFEEILGYEERAKWFRLAREADPDSKLYLNEYDILDADARVEDYKRLAGSLIEDGAAVQGMGVQGHFFDQRPNPQGQLWERLESLAGLGLPIQITEFDMNARWTQQEQADFLETLYVTAFSHPLVTGITMWAVNDPTHWLGNAPLFDAGWALKPSGQRWVDLVYGEWWTDETRRVEGPGWASVRGFLGDYEVTARRGRFSGVAQARLEPAGSVVEVKLGDR